MAEKNLMELSCFGGPHFFFVVCYSDAVAEEIILSRDKIVIELETRNSVTFKVKSRKGGMPYFYVNDVPNGFWRLYCRSENGEDDYPMLPPYCNNIGTGEIYIRSISES